MIAFQLFGSYTMLRGIFRWLALALFAYVGAAIIAKPNLGELVRGTFIPHIEFNIDFLSMIVACIGTSLSAYIYTWQSNQEVEDKIAQGQRTLRSRRGVTHQELKAKRADVFTGMLFANVILYAIILSTGAPLHKAGHTDIDTAAQAAAALEPLAGGGAKYLFALGVVGVGMLAVPVMTTGAAYDLVQGFGKEGSLHDRVGDAKLFYAIIVAVTVLAVAMNFLGFNPMRMLVGSGIVQGFSVPPLLLLMMVMTNDRAVLGDKANGLLTKLLGWTTVVVTALAAAGLVVTWIV